MRSEKAKAKRREYEQSEAGKASKRACEERYRLSGGRAAAEKRRSLRPISEARLAARARWAKTEVGKAYYASWQSGRRTKLATPLSELDWFVLLEAQRLSKLRERMLGTKWHVDHIIPVSLGGTNEYTNIQVVPAAWNLKKGNRHSDRFFNAVPRPQDA